MNTNTATIINLPVVETEVEQPTETVEFAYTVDNLTMFIDGTMAVAGNFQKFVTGMIEDNQVSVMLDYCNEIAGEYEGKELNNRLSILRTQIRRACRALDMDVYTIKKVEGKYAFVLASKQAPAGGPDGQQDGQQEGQPEGQQDDTDSLHTEAARLMARFMQSRSIDDAAKVTEFMMGLVV